MGQPDCVPNLTRRFAGSLATRAEVRRRFAQLEDQWDRTFEPVGEKTANLVPVARVRSHHAAQVARRRFRLRPARTTARKPMLPRIHELGSGTAAPLI